jgi:voltage-gated potassium channel Kch
MPRSEPRFGFLLAGLIAYLILGPLAHQLFGEMDGLVLMLALNSILVIGIFSLRASHLMFVTGATLATISVLLTIVDYFTGETAALKLIALIDIFVFLVLSITMAIMHLFHQGEIKIDRLLGGICIYIMLGICWSIVYMFLIWWQPDSFAGVAAGSPNNPLFWDMVYFSFVTLTTLGYGDITTLTPVSRALAYTEAMTGQLFLAILIGTLVGHLAGKINR